MPWLDEALEMNWPPVSDAPRAPLCAECSPSGSKKKGCFPQTLTPPSARAASKSSEISVEGVMGYPMTPPQTWRMTWAMAPLPWMTTGSPGYLGVCETDTAISAVPVSVGEEARSSCSVVAVLSLMGVSFVPQYSTCQMPGEGGALKWSSDVHLGCGGWVDRDWRSCPSDQLPHACSCLAQRAVPCLASDASRRGGPVD